MFGGVFSGFFDRGLRAGIELQRDGEGFFRPFLAAIDAEKRPAELDVGGGVLGADQALSDHELRLGVQV